MWLQFLFELQKIETYSAAIFFDALYSKPNRKKNEENVQAEQKD